MTDTHQEDSTSECSSEEEGPLQLMRPNIDRLLKEKVNHKNIIINVSLTQYPVVSEVAAEFGWHIQSDKEAGDWDICWTDYSIEPSILIRMHFHQKINHFPGIHLIARKNLLGINLMSLKNILPQEYNFFPSTWMLPSQYAEFRAFYESTKEGKVRTYIVKPEAECQGRGIFLTRNIKDLENGKHYVIQRYITKPYLIDGLKFDLRIYVLLAGSPMRVYIYEEGLARFATVPYEQPDGSNMDDMCMHLTNYAINKLNPNFVFNTSSRDMNVGHKRSLTSIYKLLEKRGEDIGALKNRINTIIVKTLLTGMPSIDHQYRHCQPEEYSGNMCFHVLGFDVMINEKMEPFLIEVNHTPSFTTDTPLDQSIKYRLVKDSLILMNINTKTKKSLFTKAQQYNQERLLTGKRQIYHQGVKPKEFIEAQEERDEYQNTHLGGFEKIHPVSDLALQERYDNIYTSCSRIYFEKDAHTAKLEQREAKKLYRMEQNAPKKTAAQRIEKKPSGSLEVTRNFSMRTNVAEKKSIETHSLSRPQKSFIIRELTKKQSLNKLAAKSFLNPPSSIKQQENANVNEIRLLESQIVFPQAKKNSRALSLKRRKSLKIQEEAKKINFHRPGSFLVPKIFSLNLEIERKLCNE